MGEEGCEPRRRQKKDVNRDEGEEGVAMGGKRRCQMGEKGEIEIKY